MPAQDSFITIISGYPRSGTSLMMQMLAAGGMPILVDEFMKPDKHNPRGYFEFERAMKLGGEGETTDWMVEALGKAVKVFAYRLEFLPTEYNYRVIFMRRKIAEVLASLGKMGLIRPDVQLSEREQILSFKTEYALFEARLMKQSNARVLFVQYDELFADSPVHIGRIRGFLGLPLAPDAMEGAIDLALYRNRSQ